MGTLRVLRDNIEGGDKDIRMAGHHLSTSGDLPDTKEENES